eukprot:Phypoly_transcript_14658.p1 GENE.Phypoly_transcript_14658~~Phypoly_transcript_14658.p1  ORF type:complete len:290 (+),score=20.77 Phypoly_transcript_14658:131-871(+)
MGVILLVVGFVKFNRSYPPVPYFWSITLCRVNGTEKWVGMELDSRQECPPNVKESEPQTIKIPPGILIASVPYIPVIYVTNKVHGTLEFTHVVDGVVEFASVARLASLEVTKFEYCGGMELVVLRDGPLLGEGDYITTDCENYVAGCQYEPGRSLNGYRFDNVKYVKLDNIPPEGSELRIDAIMLEADHTSIIMPDAYISYEVGGRGDEQDLGLILLVIGALMADLMPAAIYFLVSKPAVPGTYEK